MSQGGYYFLSCVSVCVCKCVCVRLCTSPLLEALPSAPPSSFSLCQLSNFPFVAAVGNFKFWHFWKHWPDPTCLPLLHTPSCSCSLAVFPIAPQFSLISKHDYTLTHLSRSPVWCRFLYVSSLHLPAYLFSEKRVNKVRTFCRWHYHMWLITFAHAHLTLVVLNVSTCCTALNCLHRLLFSFCTPAWTDNFFFWSFFAAGASCNLL